MRRQIASMVMKVGAKLWQPAFDKGTQDEYKNLTLSEKIGFWLFDWSVRQLDLTDDLERFAKS